MKPLLNSDQICEYLNISYGRFLHYTREDSTFPARKLGGEWKADPDELQEWFKSQPGCGMENVVQLEQRRKRGRPPRATMIAPRGGYQIRIPE
jgi:hypothetical protein